MGDDRSQLSHMAEQARSALDAKTLEVVADRGYYAGEEILACEEAAITVYLPKPMTSPAKTEGRFGKQDFVYSALPLDNGMSGVLTESQMHDRQGAPDQTLGARSRS